MSDSTAKRKIALLKRIGIRKIKVVDTNKSYHVGSDTYR
jgi:hypothetical protein